MTGLLCATGWGLAAVLAAALWRRRGPPPTPPADPRAEQLALVGEVAAAVAHEIKNPLAPIRGYAQMMTDRLEHVDEPERALFARGLSIIQTEVARIDGRIGTLLGFARAGARPQATFAVLEVVRDVADLAAASPGVQAVTVEAGGAITARGDADAIRGALLNLVRNAGEAMLGAGGGPLTLRVFDAEGEVRVEVLDAGPGLAEGFVERAFASTKPRGTGLGLLVARGAARAAGGRLELENRPEGGAVARLVLPRA